ISLPGPKKCSWPTNSSTVRGRMRAASGWALRRLASWTSWNRSMAGASEKGRSGRSDRPIVDDQTRNTAKVATVASEYGQLVGQGHRSNFQVLLSHRKPEGE